MSLFGRKRKAAIVAAVFGVAVVLIAAVTAMLVHRHHRYKHVAVHDPGRVYRSAWLEPDVLAELIDRYSIRTVVNLCHCSEGTPAGWNLERQTVHSAGARFVAIPLNVSTSLNDPQVKATIELLRHEAHYPMLVHCEHGVIRTAKFLAIYDILYRGMSGVESLAAMPLFGHGKHHKNVPIFAERLYLKRKRFSRVRR